MRMTDQVQQPTPPEHGQPRFEATIHPGEAGEPGLDRVAELDLDRIPDPEDTVRVLVNLEDIAQLVQQGLEVRLHRVVPVQPLDPRLISGDDQVRAWFDERIRATGQDEVP
jgi:hypothetical protein